MFGSFFLAGFECTTGFNRQRQWIDQIAATEHDRQVDEDYRRLVDCGLLGVREGIRWPLVDHAGQLDFAAAEPFIEAAQRHRLRVIWDLFHYGYPADLDPFQEAFITRFCDYCRAAARWVASRSEGPYFFTPVNEPSFLAWAAGDQALFAPHLRGHAPQLKRRLIEAAIGGINALREVIPAARMVNADPWCRVVPAGDPLSARALADCRAFNQVAVYESWDMLCGRLHPELGGSRAHLDIIGINYYANNQWELGQPGGTLTPDDPRRWRLLDGLREVHQRYGGDCLISETSDVGERRAGWLRQVRQDCADAISEGIRLQGCCLYPILGMPEWHQRDQWTQMGLWECQNEQGRLTRVLHQPMYDALLDSGGRLMPWMRPPGHALADPLGEDQGEEGDCRTGTA